MCDKGYELHYCANVATPYDIDGKICEVFHKCIQMWKGFYSLRRMSLGVLIFNEGGTRCAALQSKRNVEAVFLRLFGITLRAVGGGI